MIILCSQIDLGNSPENKDLRDTSANAIEFFLRKNDAADWSEDLLRWDGKLDVDIIKAGVAQANAMKERDEMTAETKDAPKRPK